MIADRWYRHPVDSRAAVSTGRAVRLGVVTGLLSFSVLLVASSFWRSNDAPIRNAPVTPHDPTVYVWIGELAPGVKSVLASPWNQSAWDVASDSTLRTSRGSALPTDLVLYDVWLFNTTEHAVSVSLKDGSLVVTSAQPSESILPLRSLSSWLSPKEGAPAPQGGPATVLRALGADRDTIELPPGRMTRHPVALANRVELAGLRSVKTADGTPFRLRRMGETEWAALIQSPRRSDLENLR